MPKKKNKKNKNLLVRPAENPRNSHQEKPEISSGYQRITEREREKELLRKKESEKKNYKFKWVRLSLDRRVQSLDDTWQEGWKIVPSH